MLVNGKKISVKQKPGSYIVVTCQWKDGDRIEAIYPMQLRIETIPDNCKRGVLLYGPLVLAAEQGTEGMLFPAPFSNSKLYNDYYTYDYRVPKGFQTTLSINIKHPECVMECIGKEPKFSTEQGDIICPLYDVHHQRYMVYWSLKDR